MKVLLARGNVSERVYCWLCPPKYPVGLLVLCDRDTELIAAALWPAPQHCLASLYSGLIRRRHQPTLGIYAIKWRVYVVRLLVNWDKTMLRFSICRQWESDTWHSWHCEDDKVTYLCGGASLPWPQRAASPRAVAHNNYRDLCCNMFCFEAG